jgi:hypothetical protein
MIVDAHTHIHAEKNGMGPGHDASLAALLTHLETGSIDKAVILAEAVDVPYIKRIENEFVAACCREHPERLIGFASVHPDESGAVARFEDAVRRDGLRGLKLHPRFQGVAANDPRIVPLVEKAAELGVPVMVDTLLWKPAPLRLQAPILVDDLCKRVPEAKVILAHAGGFHFMDALAVVVANDNAYLETSVSLMYFKGTPFESQFMFALKQAGARRLIYGSDYPQKPMHETFENSRALFRQYGFTDEDMAWFFGKTLLSLLSTMSSGCE